MAGLLRRSVSHDRADGPPITVFHFVKDRSVDVDRREPGELRVEDGPGTGDGVAP